jgi:LEM3 (ligand-effect modulator 3) family / CDC50 family
VRKYYGRIDEDLRKGDKLQFGVDHKFNTYNFGGSKQLMFTTQGSFGNRNLTFGLVWLVMGVLCGIITVTFLLVGWRQLWSKEERKAFLKQRWAAGDVHGPSRRAAALGQ